MSRSVPYPAQNRPEPAEECYEDTKSMSRNVPMIGLSPDELPWVRNLVSLLRHPDPTIPELARQALLYLSRAAQNSDTTHTPPVEPSKKTSVLHCME